MLIGGLEKLSLVDYPQKIAATVFTLGCNFACPYCQNPELVDAEKIQRQPLLKEKEFFEFLEARRGLLDGICLTGGEPLLQPDLGQFITKIKAKGFLVKLDTNGSRPKLLKELLQKKLLDFVAMDVKSVPDKYFQAVGKKIDLNNIYQSVKLIKNGRIDYEFRMTVAPGLIEAEDMKKIGQWLKGARHFSLQQFRTDKTLKQSWQKIKPYSEAVFREMSKILKASVDKVEIRGI